MNKKMRCAVAAALVLVTLVSVIVMSGLGQSGGNKATDELRPGGNIVYLSAGNGATPDGDTATVIGFDPLVSGDATPDEAEGTVEPTEAPTEGVIEEGTIAGEPTETPTVEPTAAPTEDATAEPSEGDTEIPSQAVFEDPTVDPALIGEVQTITRSDPEEGVIHLEWNAAEGAQGYHIYWRDADALTDSYSLLSSVKDTSLTIRNLKKGCMYYFKVSGYKAVDGRLVDGEGATLKAGTTPVGVSSFYLASGVPTGTLLKWTKNNLCDGYILYRQFNGVWSRYEVLPRDVTEYRDTDVIPGRAYNYRLCTYRMDATGELESSSILVKTICGLCAPADNGTTTLLRKMYFKWKKNPYAHGYEVRYSSDNKEFKLLTDTTNTYYTSNRFINGKTYYFRIYPYRIIDGDTKIYGTYWGKTLTITNSAYGKEVPNTYIEVNIAQQHMWYYIDGELYVSTDVVTGNYNSMDTPKGYWEINSKCSPATLVGDGYVSYVDYWMAFIGSGYGIHDASWRSQFGGQIYKGNGSHGCINTPYANVKKMYAKVKIGTPVIVY